MASRIANPLLVAARKAGFNLSGRNPLVARFSWAIPNTEAIRAIAALSPIVEIGAGTGYWASLLTSAGADIVAYDLQPPPTRRNHYHELAEPHFNVRKGNAAVSARHADRTLMLCWPPCGTPMARTALAAYCGQIVVYVGESWGGCNADDAFFRRLDKEWGELACITIPQWSGLHDFLWIYERKESWQANHAPTSGRRSTSASLARRA